MTRSIIYTKVNSKGLRRGPLRHRLQDNRRRIEVFSPMRRAAKRTDRNELRQENEVVRLATEETIVNRK